jgi:hypothetical protein
MPLNNTTKYRIANKFTNGKLNKDEFDFENKGKYGKGRLSWSVPIKKDGQTTFDNSSIGFVCFGENIEIFANNLNAKFDITGNISQKKNQNATGDQPKNYWQIVVSEVKIIEEAKPVDSHNTAKANSYVKETEDLDDDLLPF